LAERGGWFGRFRQGLARTHEALSARLDGLLGRELDPAVFDELEETLLQADLGVRTTDAAIARLREQSTPYHLAHGLLDHAAHLLRMDQDDAAAAALGEAAGIAERLRCRPLLDRAETIQSAQPRTAAS